MKKIFITIIWLSIIAYGFMLNSCDKLDPPYKQKVEYNKQDTSRKVLLEEFTGHKCVNCPSAAEEIENLKNIYGENLIVVSIHAGIYAQPESGTFNYDFTTNAGKKLKDQFDPKAYPKGLISRVKDNGYLFNEKEYGFYVDSLANSKPLAMLDLSTSYNSNNDYVDIEVSGTALSSLAGEYKLSVYLTEDSIIKPQKNNDSLIGPTPVINDYTHMHVLRGAVNGAWGDNYFSGPVDSLDNLPVKNYSYTIKNEWKSKDCHIVAFIYRSDNASGNEYEVIQAGKIAVE